MSQLTFTIANGILEVSGGGRTAQYQSTDYKAKTWSNGIWDGIIVFPVFGCDEPYGTGTFTTKRYQDFALVIGEAGGVSPASAASFVTLFNNAVGTSLGFNTQYPSHIISEKLDPDTSIPLQVTAHAKAGYLTFTTPAGNGGSVFIGGSDVDNQSYALVADKSVYMELFNLSTIYIMASTPGDTVGILGAYKD